MTMEARVLRPGTPRALVRAIAAAALLCWAAADAKSLRVPLLDAGEAPERRVMTLRANGKGNAAAPDLGGPALGAKKPLYETAITGLKGAKPPAETPSEERQQDTVGLAPGRDNRPKVGQEEEDDLYATIDSNNTGDTKPEGVVKHGGLPGAATEGTAQAQKGEAKTAFDEPVLADQDQASPINPAALPAAVGASEDGAAAPLESSESDKDRDEAGAMHASASGTTALEGEQPEGALATGFSEPTLAEDTEPEAAGHEAESVESADEGDNEDSISAKRGNPKHSTAPASEESVESADDEEGPDGAGTAALAEGAASGTHGNVALAQGEDVDDAQAAVTDEEDEEEQTALTGDEAPLDTAGSVAVHKDPAPAEEEEEETGEYDDKAAVKAGFSDPVLADGASASSDPDTDGKAAAPSPSAARNHDEEDEEDESAVKTGFSEPTLADAEAVAQNATSDAESALEEIAAPAEAKTNFSNPTLAEASSQVAAEEYDENIDDQEGLPVQRTNFTTPTLAEVDATSKVAEPELEAEQGEGEDDQEPPAVSDTTLAEGSARGHDSDMDAPASGQDGEAEEEEEEEEDLAEKTKFNDPTLAEDLAEGDAGHVSPKPASEEEDGQDGEEQVVQTGFEDPTLAEDDAHERDSSKAVREPALAEERDGDDEEEAEEPVTKSNDPAEEDEVDEQDVVDQTEDSGPNDPSFDDEDVDESDELAGPDEIGAGAGHPPHTTKPLDMELGDEDLDEQDNSDEFEATPASDLGTPEAAKEEEEEDLWSDAAASAATAAGKSSGWDDPVEDEEEEAEDDDALLVSGSPHNHVVEGAPALQAGLVAYQDRDSGSGQLAPLLFLMVMGGTCVVAGRKLFAATNEGYLALPTNESGGAMRRHSGSGHHGSVGGRASSNGLPITPDVVRLN